MSKSIDSFLVPDLLELRAAENAHHSSVIALIDLLLLDKGVDVSQPELPFHYPDDDSDTYSVDDF